MVSEMAGFFKTKTNKLSLILAVTVLGLLVLGCIGGGGPAYQGWSGFAGQDGILYFGSMDGRVFAVNPVARSQNLTFPSEGEWVFTVPAPTASGGMCGFGCAPAARPAIIYGTPAVAGNLVYVATYASDGGRVFAIDPSARNQKELFPARYKEGKEGEFKGEWSYPSGDKKPIGVVVGGPVVVKDTLYVGSSDGKLYALDVVKGQERWEFDTGDKIWTSPAVEDGFVCASNYGRKLFAVSSVDGKKVWPEPISLSASIVSSPVVSGNALFFGTFDNYLYAVNSADGTEKWKFKGGNWFWSTPVIKDGVVYAGCLDHKIYTLKAETESETGEKLWDFPTDAPIVSTPVLVDNLLVVASESGMVYMLNTESGKLEHDPVPVVNAPAKVLVRAPLYAEGNMVYVHASNRCVYGVDVQSGKEVWKFPYSDVK
jgi:outer membrane protein assembly factor BamB